MQCPHPSVLGCSFVLCIPGTRLISLPCLYYIKSSYIVPGPIRLPLELIEAKCKYYLCLFSSSPITPRRLSQHPRLVFQALDPDHEIGGA